jgi:hypothetical protein
LHNLLGEINLFLISKQAIMKKNKCCLSPMTEADILRTAEFSKTAFFKEKYRKGLKTLTKYEMRQFRKAHPDAQLKDVLAALVKDYSPELPPSILLEMTQFIIAEWERTPQTDPVLC